MASVSFSDMTEIDDTDWDIGSTEMINERDSPLLIQGKSKLLRVISFYCNLALHY